MKKFCTNCGHANNSSNQVCIECGTPFAKEPNGTQHNGPKKPMPFKTKLIAGIGVVLLASLIGLYSWGTKTATAETTVSKFFEALQEKDAAALTKYAALSNGEEITEKEASAFIDLYQNLTQIELEDMATIEKKGKVAGIFDAHKVILSTQQVSYYFPYEGLSLKLNGKNVPSVQNEDEYVFSGIVPGNYKAEFIFDDEKTEFAYPFDLTVESQWDSSNIASLEEELPIGSTTFQVTVGDYSTDYESKIIVGDKEFEVNEYGETESVGPFLLDGSMKVLAKVEFPWGAETSEAVPIDDDYISVDIPKLNEKAEKELIDQFALFMEEHVEARGTRNASVYTTLTPGNLKSMADEFDSWKDSEYFFKGSLTKINLDGESIQLSSEGVSVDAEVVGNAAYYYQSDTPEMETIKSQIHAVFTYDSNKKKWLVDEVSEYQNYDREFIVEPLQSLEGSKKTYEVKGSTDPVNRNAEESVQSADLTSEVEYFMGEYNASSVIAMNAGDFSYVSFLIDENGPKWKESADYIDYVYSKGITEECLGTTVEKIETIDDATIKVTTIEKYHIYGTEKPGEKTFRSVNLLKKDGSSWLVNKLISTTEI
ncbi:TcaA NTF2-like domain-containing protein [Planococcus sp. YIM B11945]|uniref:TcaA NTF2-like domain-containing protein n=1 Tax=Planococcus sp. YIM B11945 TaxID=3435410 RepID=UPI003D7EE5B9